MHCSLCACRDDKAKWIRAKYEDKEFLPPPPYVDVAMPQVTASSQLSIAI